MQEHIGKNINLILITGLIFLLPSMHYAQVTDDFSDGDFTNDPSWTGDINHFIINQDHQLQLNDETTGVSYLSTENSMINNSEWRFRIMLKFSPSSNNNARIYLISDQMNLKEPLNGFFLQFGESGSDDAIELFRQEGDESFSICRGTTGLISTSFTLGVKVIHKEKNWEIYADPTGGVNYQPEATGTDSTYSQANYFGVYTKYTSSNSKKFYFDDFYAGPIIVDSISPEVVSIMIAGENQLDILFSEGVDKTTAEEQENYLVDGNIGHPDSVWREEANPEIVHLAFSNIFINSAYYVLTIKDVEDLSGNKMEPVSIPFSYFIPEPYDIVINEIMADPGPVVGLPNYEYLELYNLTSFPVSLDGWTLTIGSGNKEFQQVTIEAESFLILGVDYGVNYLSPYGPYYGFSSFTLTNTGQSLALSDQDGVLIFSVTYEDDWYRDANKQDGGWSLEMINPWNPCAGAVNWKASTHQEGGTPGRINSIYEEIDIPVEFEKICCIDDSTFKLYFNQSMDPCYLSKPLTFEVDQGIGHPVNVFPDEPGYWSATLVFNSSLEKGRIYTLYLSDSLSNCIGLPMSFTSQIRLGVPEPAGYFDIVINEILFNPLGGGEDYVEIYNRSDKIIDLEEISLSTIKVNFPDPPDTTIKKIVEDCYLFYPGEYLVLTKDPVNIRNYYYTSNPDGFIKMESFPSYNNDKGIIAINKTNGDILDIFCYEEEMHHPLLNSYEGVALERINFDRPAQDETNWHSAAEQAGYGTPAYENSQFVPGLITDEMIVVEPEIFIPDNYNGVNNILNINYHFDKPGYMANILVFDATGRLIRHLVENAMLGVKGAFSWDGFNDHNLKAGIGIYVIFTEVFDLQGNVRRFKDVAVLGGRF